MPNSKTNTQPAQTLHTKPVPGDSVRPAASKSPGVVDEVAMVEAGEKVSILKPGLLVKAAALALVNLVAVSGIIIIVSRLDSKAQEIKRLRSVQLTASKGGEAHSALRAEVEAAEEKRSELIKYFPNSEGLITFVEEIDKLKAEGILVGFSFANEVPVKDKTGALGLPVVFELSGNWEQVGATIQKIMSLPYMLRAILFEAETSPEDPTLVQVKFGSFLYVDKTFE